MIIFVNDSGQVKVEKNVFRFVIKSFTFVQRDIKASSVCIRFLSHSELVQSLFLGIFFGWLGFVPLIFGVF